MAKKLLRIFALGGNEISPTGQVDPKTGKTEMPGEPFNCNCYAVYVKVENQNN